MYWIDVDIENNTSKSITTKIPMGTVLESNDPGLTVQCLVVASDVLIHIPPRSKKTVKLPALCMNKDLSSPHNTPGKLTPFALRSVFDSQADVWNHIGKK